MRTSEAGGSISRSYDEVLRPGVLARSFGGARATASLVAPVSLVTGVFIACAWLSWRRLGSLIVDGGHELDVPRRLLEGAVLYRDFTWNWGPLSPWLNTGLYRVFGVHSDTLMWAGLVTAGLACLGLFLLARHLVGPFTSAWVAIAFLLVSAFARRGDIAIFSFVFPFNFSATYGITLAIWSVLLLIRHARSGRPATLAASAVLAGLVALTKLETTFAVAAAHGAFAVTVLPRPSRARVIAWGSGVPVAVLGYGVAAWTAQGHLWRSMVDLLNGSSRFYITDSMGIRDLGLSLLDLGHSLLAWAIVLAGAIWVARSAGDAPRDWRALALSCAVLLVVPALVLERTFFRAAPLLLAAGLLWIVLTRVREGEAALDGQWREHLVLWAFALGALPRILLRAGPEHYGFYLLPPTLVCVAIGMTRYLARPGGGPFSARTAGIGASSLLAGVALGGFLACYHQLTKPMTEVRTARVHLLVNPDGPEASFLPDLSALPPRTVCAAVPEGAGLVFAAGLTPPDDGMTAYIPMVLHDPANERAILRAWERKPPGVILQWNEDQSRVFGFTGFGKDYGLELARWISERYELVKTSPQGRAALLRPRPRG